MVYDRNTYPGGHTASFVHDGFVFDDGPHISFTRDERLQNLLADAVDGRFEIIQTRVNNHWRGHWIKHPAQCNLHGLPEDLVVSVLEDFVAAQHAEPAEIRDYEAWLVAAFGRTFAETFPMEYGAKYHTCVAREMTTDWLGPRLYRPALGEVLRGALSAQTPDVHYVSHFRYPSHGGFAAYLAPFVAASDIRLAHEVVSIDPAKRSLRFADGAVGAYRRLVFVGGCVRDSLAGRPVNDIDIATVDPPERVLELLAAAGLKGVPTGLQHGTVTAIASHQPFEVTTLRRDVESHGRHATVAFTDDWQADAARRDFTMNALSLSPEGGLFDPFDGRADLAAGRVRFVGRASDRIREDYLRLLRFFRFQATYGRGAPDPEGLAAARELAPGLSRLSGERIRAELVRLLAAEDPVPVLDIMAEAEIWASVLPELGGSSVLKALIAQDRSDGEILRLAALLPVDREAAKRVARRLRLSRRDRERLVAAAGGDVPLEPKALRRALYRLGAETISDRLALAAARTALTAEEVRTAWAEIESWKPLKFPLKGRDALALGVAPGAEVGRLLAELEAWWIEQDFQPSRADCLARLKQFAEAP